VTTKSDIDLGSARVGSPLEGARARRFRRNLRVVLQVEGHSGTCIQVGRTLGIGRAERSFDSRQSMGFRAGLRRRATLVVATAWVASTLVIAIAPVAGGVVRPHFDPNYGQGYWEMTNEGDIYALGDAPFEGPTGSIYTGQAFTSMTPSVDSEGYALVDQTGQVYAFGDQQYEGGSPTGYSGSFVSIVRCDGGLGYWLLDSTGQVYAEGGATYYGGSPTGYSGSFVSLSPSADHQGYILVDSTGQTYAYGDQQNEGGGGLSNIVSSAMEPVNGLGYWLVSASGGVYAYGDAGYLGGLGNLSYLPYPIMNIAATVDGQGYRLEGSDGGLFDYGDAQDDGTGLTVTGAPPPGSVSGFAIAH